MSMWLVTLYMETTSQTAMYWTLWVCQKETTCWSYKKQLLMNWQWWDALFSILRYSPWLLFRSAFLRLIYLEWVSGHNESSMGICWLLIKLDTMSDRYTGSTGSVGLRVALVTLLLAYWGYSYVQKRRQHEVQNIPNCVPRSSIAILIFQRPIRYSVSRTTAYQPSKHFRLDGHWL